MCNGLLLIKLMCGGEGYCYYYQRHLSPIPARLVPSHSQLPYIFYPTPTMSLPFCDLSIYPLLQFLDFVFILQRYIICPMISPFSLYTVILSFYVFFFVYNYYEIVDVLIHNPLYLLNLTAIPSLCVWYPANT